MLDVARDNVLIPPGRVTIPGGPFFQLGQFADEENADALAFGTRLHNPQRSALLDLDPSKFFDKERIVGGKCECHRYDLINFRCATRALDFFTILFNVLDHQILSGKFIVIWEMIYELILAQPHHN